MSLYFYETFGVNVLDSLALETPIIVFSVPAIEEVLGCDFLILPYGEVDGPANLVYRILNDCPFRLSIREYLTERAMVFTPEKSSSIDRKL